MANKIIACKIKIKLRYDNKKAGKIKSDSLVNSGKNPIMYASDIRKLKGIVFNSKGQLLKCFKYSSLRLAIFIHNTRKWLVFPCRMNAS